MAVGGSAEPMRARPSYPDRRALTTRASSAEVSSVEDSAATTIDRLVFTEDMLAERPASRTVDPEAPPDSGGAAAPALAPALPTTSWPALLAAALLGALMGAAAMLLLTGRG